MDIKTEDRPRSERSGDVRDSIHTIVDEARADVVAKCKKAFEGKEEFDGGTLVCVDLNILMVAGPKIDRSRALTRWIQMHGQNLPSGAKKELENKGVIVMSMKDGPNRTAIRVIDALQVEITQEKRDEIRDALERNRNASKN